MKRQLKNSFREKMWWTSKQRWGDWNYSGPVQSWRQVVRLQQIEFSRHRPHLLFIDELGASLRNPHLLKSVVSLCLVASLAVCFCTAPQDRLNLLQLTRCAGLHAPLCRRGLEMNINQILSLDIISINTENSRYIIDLMIDYQSDAPGGWYQRFPWYTIQHSIRKRPNIFRPFAYLNEFNSCTV